MGKHLLFTLGLLLSLATTLRADVTVSDGSTSTFDAAVSTVKGSGGGTITVTRPIVITNGTPDGESFDGESMVTVSGGNTNAIFIVKSGSLTLANMTITGGRAQLGGAVNIASGAAGTFSSCTFSNNHVVGTNGASAISNTNGSGNVIIGNNGGRGGAGGSVSGGAIYNLGNLALLECTFITNTAVGGSGGDGADGQDAGTRAGNGGRGGAGGTAIGGAVCSAGTLVVSNCTFSGNQAEGGSGGIGGLGGSAIVPGANGLAGLAGVASGGGLYSSSLGAVILNSTFDNNSTQGGDASTGGTNPSGIGQTGPRGGDALGAGVANTGSLSITNSTFYQNSASGGAGGDGGVGGVKGGAGGGGGNAIGGGVYNSGSITVVNCTFSKGDASGGDSGAGGSGVTVGKNGKAGGNFGGNIANVAKKRNTGFTLANSIIGEATSGNGGYGKIASGGYNLSADKSINFKKDPTSLPNTNALAGGGDLADNGGPTETIALDVDSPAVDRIPTEGDNLPEFAPPTSDQRQLFDRPVGSGFDVGAYELDPERATIRTQPLGTNVVAGSNAVFSVTAGGLPPFTYQWLFNGAPLSNETNATLSITNAQSLDQGAYRVIVANDHNSVTSRVAQLDVHAAPNPGLGFSQQPPAQQNVIVGTNVTISATVTGAVPVFYQWYFTDQQLTTLPLAGANTNFITFTNVQLTNFGIYQLIVTNASGSVASDFSKLVVTTNSATTNTTGISPGIRGTPAKLRSLSRSSRHGSASVNETTTPDAEPNRPARKQFIFAGNSFPEFRRRVIAPELVTLAFNRRSVYL
jgi:hypothetical protein